MMHRGELFLYSLIMLSSENTVVTQKLLWLVYWTAVLEVHMTILERVSISPILENTPAISIIQTFLERGLQ